MRPHANVIRSQKCCRDVRLERIAPAIRDALRPCVIYGRTDGPITGCDRTRYRKRCTSPTAYARVFGVRYLANGKTSEVLSPITYSISDNATRSLLKEERRRKKTKLNFVVFSDRAQLKFGERSVLFSF